LDSGRLGLSALLACAFLAMPAHAQPASPGQTAPPDSSSAAETFPAPAPASGLTWRDVPNDAGRSVVLDWKLSPDDAPGATVVTRYVIERSPNPGGPWVAADSALAGVQEITDGSLQRDFTYYYRVIVVGPGGRTPALSVTGPVIATSQWFNRTRWSVLVGMILYFGFVLYFIWRAQSGKKPFVRRIAGVDAIEEAIGRATEMGRSVMYVPGIQDIDEIQTVQGLVILESVAKLTARYQTPITVPVAYPIPFTIAEEMVRGGHLHAGHPELYDPNSVRFVSPEQFAFAAAITGIILRDKPAAVIYMGSFFGESLLLAETAFSTGAIQVAGTANVHQLPFFVVACDYTLIGEELYAASAYLSGEPKLVGGLKGADLMKVLIIATLLVGCVLETFGVHGLTRALVTQ
jgi:hypothetical protein